MELITIENMNMMYIKNVKILMKKLTKKLIKIYLFKRLINLSRMHNNRILKKDHQAYKIKPILSLLYKYLYINFRRMLKKYYKVINLPYLNN